MTKYRHIWWGTSW